MATVVPVVPVVQAVRMHMQVWPLRVLRLEACTIQPLQKSM
jgi:hypothetical protein